MSILVEWPLFVKYRVIGAMQDITRHASRNSQPITNSEAALEAYKVH